MKNCVLIAAFLGLSFVFLKEEKVKIYLIGDSTMSEKDSSAYPETGWGMCFKDFLDSTVILENHAKNGRSTRTFLSENRWKPVADQLKKGDYVFIQFGHNDEVKEKKDRYTSPEEFRANLEKFVRDTKRKNAIPVLLTPVSRRKFDSTGTVIETHPVYTSIVLDLAKKEKVHCIDLDKKSRELYQQMGEENSKQLFLWLKPGEHPNYPQGKQDNTHFNTYGALKIAEIVVHELKSLKIDLVKNLK